MNGNGNDYHLACKQEAWLIFYPAEMEMDRHIISQNKKYNRGSLVAGVLTLSWRRTHGLFQGHKTFNDTQNKILMGDVIFQR